MVITAAAPVDARSMQAEAIERSGLVAADVGAAYMAAKSMPHDARVAGAYKRLQAETDQLFHDAHRTDVPNRMRIVFTRCRAPYASDTELIEAFNACRVLEVTTAAISVEPIHPILDCEFGGAFDRFRAVHDLIGHARTGLGFDLVDEFEAWRLQDRLHSDPARSALATELLAINSAWPILGEAPPHKAVLLAPALLQRSKALISKRPLPARLQQSPQPALGQCRHGRVSPGSMVPITRSSSER